MSEMKKIGITGGIGVGKKGNEGEFLPVLAVAASLDSRGEGIGGGGGRLQAGEER